MADGRRSQGRLEKLRNLPSGTVRESVLGVELETNESDSGEVNRRLLTQVTFNKAVAKASKHTLQDRLFGHSYHERGAVQGGGKVRPEDAPRRAPSIAGSLHSVMTVGGGRAGARAAKGQPMELALASFWHDVLIHPLSVFRHYWDSVAIVLVVYTTLVLPVRTAFFWDTDDESLRDSQDSQQIQMTAWVIIDIFIDFFFMTDIILNFNTGYIAEPDQVVVMDRRLVAKRYGRSWFVPDVLSSIPLDLVFLGNKSDVWRLPRVIRLLRLSRLLRLLRLSRAIRYASRMTLFANMSSFHLRITKLLVVAVVYSHWNACLQFLVVAASGFPAGNWVDLIDAEDADLLTQYTWSLFNAFSHMLCIGYGQNAPGNVAEAWVTMVSMITGASLFAVFVGIITSLLIQMDAVASQYNAKMDVVNQYMAHRKLPPALRERIRESYDYKWKTRRVFDENAVLAELPGSLRTEVAIFTCMDLLKSVPFFEDAEEGFVTSLVTLLKPVICLPDDVVIREGEMAREMYFIRTGCVQVECAGHPVTSLVAGSYFGEVALLRKSKRTATVRATDITELFALEKTDFDEVLQDFPESAKAMDLIADHRMKQLKRSAAYRNKLMITQRRARRVGNSSDIGRRKLTALHRMEIYGKEPKTETLAASLRALDEPADANPVRPALRESIGVGGNKGAPER